MKNAPETELPLLEREWMEAWLKKDRATCDRILGEDFLLTSARGMLMSKKEWLGGAMGPFVCEAFDWEEMRVRPFGDVAVVHSRARQRASIAGQDWSGVFLLTDVWVFRDSAGKVLSSRHLRLPEPWLSLVSLGALQAFPGKQTNKPVQHTYKYTYVITANPTFPL